MKICFVLPNFAICPVGGHKIVYEYANRFRKNHDVSIVFLNSSKFARYNFPKVVKSLLCYFFTMIEPLWFKLNKGIHKYASLEAYYKKNDTKDTIFIATGATTFSTVNQIKTDFKKIYFIQGYENWSLNETDLYKTYLGGMKNIVVSSWLKKKVEQCSASALLIRNPIDLHRYKINTPIDDRFLYSISALYHNNPNKGGKYLLEALQLVHDRVPNLLVEMFGTCERPKDLPEWIHYTRNASVAKTIEIYNKTRLFVCSSIEEGFGLTGLEAMACGNLLVTTNFEGAKEYAIDGYNALVSPVKNPTAQAELIINAFKDDKLRNKLVENAKKEITKFDWDKAVYQFEEVLNGK